jgi:(2Fe-2S) ferredoxin
MNKPKYHILVCNSFRLKGDPQGVCNKKGAVDLLQYLQEEVVDREIDAMISSTGCMKICEKGPVMVVYPQEWWYTEVDESKLDEILDAMEDDQPAESLLAT